MKNICAKSASYNSNFKYSPAFTNRRSDQKLRYGDKSDIIPTQNVENGENNTMLSNPVIDLIAKYKVV